MNLLVLILLILYLAWRNRRIQISEGQLLFAGIFPLAFGFVDAVAARVGRWHGVASLVHKPMMTRSTSETRLASLTVLILQAESAAGSDVLTGYPLAPARGREARQVCDVLHHADVEVLSVHRFLCAFPAC